MSFRDGDSGRCGRGGNRCCGDGLCDLGGRGGRCRRFSGRRDREGLGGELVDGFVVQLAGEAQDVEVGYFVVIGFGIEAELAGELGVLRGEDVEVGGGAFGERVRGGVVGAAGGVGFGGEILKALDTGEIIGGGGADIFIYLAVGLSGEDDGLAKMGVGITDVVVDDAFFEDRQVEGEDGGPPTVGGETLAVKEGIEVDADGGEIFSPCGIDGSGGGFDGGSGGGEILAVLTGGLKEGFGGGEGVGRSKMVDELAVDRSLSNEIGEGGASFHDFILSIGELDARGGRIGLALKDIKVAGDALFEAMGDVLDTRILDAERGREGADGLFGFEDGVVSTRDIEED